MDHEKKEFCLAGVHSSNFERYTFDGRTFYLVPNNVFNAIIKKNLLIAQEKYSDKFGTENAIDIIRALYEVEPWMDFESFKETLRKEQFCYVVEILDEKINDKVLRIDLYRQIEPNCNGNFDFVGGILHCFKHFSCNGRPLSTGNETIDLRFPFDLVLMTIKGFFLTELKMKPKNGFVSEIGFNYEHNLKFSFYHETKTDVYFLNTIHIKKNNR